MPSEVLPSGDYEELVESLMTQLGTAATVETERLERPTERLVGASGTTHQIDVLWDFRAADGKSWRLLFEARSYRTRLKQQAVFAFNGVVEDIAATIPGRRCVGVMVTSTGYQSGAKTVAESKDVLLMELRSPTDADWEGRLAGVHVSFVARLPVARNVHVEVLEDAPETMLGQMEVLHADGSRRGLVEILIDGETAPLGQPPALYHLVQREFSGSEQLLCDGAPVGHLRRATAEVGDSDAPFEFTVGGVDRVAWMLKNSITGARVWFAHDGRHWSTDH